MDAPRRENVAGNRAGIQQYETFICEKPLPMLYLHLSYAVDVRLPLKSFPSWSVLGPLLRCPKSGRRCLHRHGDRNKSVENLSNPDRPFARLHSSVPACSLLQTRNGRTISNRRIRVRTEK